MGSTGSAILVIGVFLLFFDFMLLDDLPTGAATGAGATGAGASVGSAMGAAATGDATGAASMGVGVMTGAGASVGGTTGAPVLSATGAAVGGGGMEESQPQRSVMKGGRKGQLSRGIRPASPESSRIPQGASG